MPGSSKHPPKQKPSEVAAETKRKYLPLIKNQYADHWQTYSWLIPHPLTQLALAGRPATLNHPTFCKCPIQKHRQRRTTGAFSRNEYVMHTCNSVQHAHSLYIRTCRERMLTNHSSSVTS